MIHRIGHGEGIKPKRKAHVLQVNIASKTMFKKLTEKILQIYNLLTLCHYSAGGNVKFH